MITRPAIRDRPLDTTPPPTGANPLDTTPRIPHPEVTPPAATTTLTTGATTPAPYVHNTTATYRPQDTIEMFSRLNPQVQTQILTFMGLSPQQAQQMVATIGQNSGSLTIDNPSIVQAWNQLFGNSGVDINALGNTIFSNSVHAADADHNYHNYGAITFTPGQGLQSTPEAGQYGEPNRRGLRQLERPLEIAAAIAGASLLFSPELLSLFGLAGPEAGAAAGVEGALDTSLIPSFATPEIGSLGALPDIIDPTLGAATTAADIPAVADSFTPNINSMIDTFQPPEVGNLPSYPELGDANPLAQNLDLNTPSGITPAMQPPPNVDIQPPDINVAGGPSTLDRITNSLTRDPLRTAGTALTVGSLLRNHPSGVPQGVQNTVNQNTPLGNQARTTLENNGAPTPDQMSVITATIEQQRKQGTEAILQASINAGQGGANSMLVQDKIRAFNEQLATMQIQLVQKQAEQNVLNALKELGMVDEEQFRLAELELRQDTLAQERAASIMRSLGWLWSVGGSNSSGSTPGPGPQ